MSETKRLTADDLARFRADYHQCGVTIVPLLDEVEALTAERDAETKRAEDWAKAHARDSRCPKCSHPFGPIGKPKGLEEDGYQCVWVCPCDCHADVPALRAEIARLQRQVEGHCDRIARQSELLSKRAEKGGEALREIVLGLLQYVEHQGGCEYYRMGKPHPCTCGLGKYTELWATLAAEGGG